MIRFFSLLLIRYLSFLRLNHFGTLMPNAWRKGSSNPVMFRFADNLRLKSPRRQLQLSSTAGSTLNYHLILIIIILVRELVLYHSQLVLSLFVNPSKSIPYHITVNLFIDKGPLHFLTTHVIGSNLGLFVLLEDQFSINRLALVVFRIPTWNKLRTDCPTLCFTFIRSLAHHPQPLIRHCNESTILRTIEA